jgi:hypothetical protein
MHRETKIVFFLSTLLIVVLAGFVSAKPSLHNTKTQKTRRYRAPDGAASVTVFPARRRSETGAQEDRIEFYGADAKLLCALDYSSEDGEHGFGVVKAGWTSDSQYFVYSLTSSGGHQPWHAPTPFYSRASGRVRELDDFFDAAGIASADFKLVAPNTVETTILREKEEAVSVRLESLPGAPKHTRRIFSITCANGQVLKVADR